MSGEQSASSSRGPCPFCGAAVGVYEPHRQPGSALYCTRASLARLERDRQRADAGWVKAIDGSWLSPEQTAAQRRAVSDAARIEELIALEDLELHAERMARKGQS